MTLEKQRSISTSHDQSFLSPYPGESLPTGDKSTRWPQDTFSQAPISLGSSLPVRFNPGSIDDIMEGLDKHAYNKGERDRIFKALKRFENTTLRKSDGTHNKDGLLDEMTGRQVFLMQLIDMVCKPNRLDAEYRSGRDYKSTHIIGEGGFGIVRHCQDISTGEIFAEKLIDKAKYKPDEMLIHKKITSDIRLMMSIDSNECVCGVVLMLGAIQQGDIIYLYMEFMEDGSLAEMLKRAEGPLAAGYIIWYFHQILEGLQFIHSRRIMHLDIKADNILIKNEDSMKIADFGLAREIPERNDGVYEGFCGTPHFMAPEVIRSEMMSTKSDVWSVGCVLYELIMQKVPWIGKEIQTIIYTVGHASKETIDKFLLPTPERLKEFTSDFQEEYQVDYEASQMILDLFDQCLQRDFKQRSTAEELLNSEIIRILFTVPDADNGEDNNEVPQSEDLVPGSEDTVESPTEMNDRPKTPPRLGRVSPTIPSLFVNNTTVDTIPPVNKPDSIPNINKITLDNIPNVNNTTPTAKDLQNLDRDSAIHFVKNERPRSSTQTQPDLLASELGPKSLPFS